MTLPAAISIEDAIAAWIAAATGIAAGLIWWEGQGQATPSSGPWISVNLLSALGVGQDWTDVEHNPLVLADDQVEAVDAGLDRMTLTGHAYQTADGPVRLTTTGALPAPLAAGVDYWLIVVDADTVKLAATFAAAKAGTAIDLTDVGAGTHTIVDTADTERAGQEVRVLQRGTRRIVASIQCHGAPPTGDSRAWAVLERLRSRYRLPAPRAAIAAGNLAVGEIGTVRSLGSVLNDAEYESRAVVEISFNGTSEASELGTYIEHVVTQGATT